MRKVIYEIVRRHQIGLKDGLGRDIKGVKEEFYQDLVRDLVALFKECDYRVVDQKVSGKFKSGLLVMSDGSEIQPLDLSVVLEAIGKKIQFVEIDQVYGNDYRDLPLVSSSIINTQQIIRVISSRQNYYYNIERD